MKPFNHLLLVNLCLVLLLALGSTAQEDFSFDHAFRKFQSFMERQDSAVEDSVADKQIGDNVLLRKSCCLNTGFKERRPSPKVLKSVFVIGI